MPSLLCMSQVWYVCIILGITQTINVYLKYTHMPSLNKYHNNMPFYLACMGLNYVATRQKLALNWLGKIINYLRLIGGKISNY